MSDALFKIAKPVGQNCLVVTQQPYVSVFVDPFKNLGATSTKKGFIVASAKDVPVEGTNATIQITVVAAKEAKRTMDDLKGWLEVAPGVEATYLANHFLQLRFNFSAFNASGKPILSVNQRPVGEQSGLVLSATAESATPFRVAQMQTVLMATPDPKAASPARHTINAATIDRLTAGAKNVSGIFAMDSSEEPYVTIVCALPPFNPRDDTQHTLAQCAPPNIGCFVTVRQLGPLLEETELRPVPGAVNVEVLESASRGIVVLRFDRTKEFSSDPDERVRTVATTAGTVVVGGSEVSVVCVYEFTDPTAEEYYDAVYKILAPRPRRGLQTLKMQELHKLVFAELEIARPTFQNRQRVRDATREYIVYGQQPKRPLQVGGELVSSHQF